MGKSKRDSTSSRSATKFKRKFKRLAKLVLLYLVVAAICVTGIWLTVVLYDRYKGAEVSLPAAPTTQSQVQSSVNSIDAVNTLQAIPMPSFVSAQFINIGTARTGAKLQDFNAIVIHFTGEPGMNASERRAYYIDPNSSISTHFVVGLDGKTLMCLPINEQANASGLKNADTISIEYCHTSYDGLMNKDTYNALVELCATILKGTGKGTDCLLRHYDINSAAECPPYYISHSDAWNKFKSDVEQKIK